MNRQIIDPSECAANIVDVHGEVGREWLGRLPGMIAECANRWSLDILAPFEGLSYNYVAPATTADGSPRLNAPDFLCPY
jgi:streptomycin 6-kinase